MGEGSQQQLLDTEGEHDIFPSVSGPDITIVDDGLACARGLLECLGLWFKVSPSEGWRSL